METLATFTERQHAGSAVTRSISDAEPPRVLAVTAHYRLSEDGRKASLLAGGDGRAVQQIALEVPGNRLHLVSVDTQGVARLKLRPRFERTDDKGILRIDTAPVYDAPPTIDELYRAAAQNHELEAVYHAERATTRSKHRDADRDRRERAAEAFLADTGQRAVAHPPPSIKRCSIITEGGQFVFDVATDHGLAKEVPPEAHRRFRADLRVKHERNQRDRALQLAVHAVKQQFVAEWIAAHGTDEQRVRQQAGMLPMAEAIERMTDDVFAAAGHLPAYTRDGSVRLQHFLRECGAVDAIVRPSDVVVRSHHAVKATAEQWTVVQHLKTLVPEANVILREHVLSSTQHQKSPSVIMSTVLVTKRYGPFVLRREYHMDPDAHADVTRLELAPIASST